MVTKTLGVVGRSWDGKKNGIELGFSDFYPNSIPTRDDKMFAAQNYE